MVCYVFHCNDCSPTQQETWVPKQANFSHMLITAMANLTWKRMAADSKDLWLSLKRDIIPYFMENWENLTSMQRRIKNTWHQTLQRTLIKETDLFATKCDASDDDAHYFALIDSDLSTIGPNNEIVKQIGRKFGPDKSGGAGMTDKVDDSEGPKTRGASKRKANENQAYMLKKNRGTNDYTSTKLTGFTSPIDHPFNRDGYRYFLVESDPHTPNRREFEDLDETAGKPIPAYMYRRVGADNTELSSHDRAPQLKLTDDRLNVTGHEGYSVVRATHGVSWDVWFFEVDLTNQSMNSHVRIGWSQALGAVQAPVGYDRFSYSIRSRKGTCFHNSVGKHYANGGFGRGDVLGCLLQFPRTKTPVITSSHKALPLIKFKNHYYYEEKDDISTAIKELVPIVGSQISFFINGRSFGPAFTDICKGTYYPAISIYRNATVRCNFGPNFHFPPTDRSFRPMCEKPEEMLIEQTLADILFFIENEGKLKLA